MNFKLAIMSLQLTKYYSKMSLLQQLLTITSLEFNFRL